MNAVFKLLSACAFALLVAVACGGSSREDAPAGSAGGGGTGGLANPCPDGVSPGGDCESVADCPPNARACVLVNCMQRCSSGTEFDTCNEDAHCGDGLACGHLVPGSSYPGSCLRPGVLGAPCAADGDCNGEARCVELGPGNKQCSEGARAHPCGAATDCLDQYCVNYACTSGIYGDACASDRDCQLGYCAPVAVISGTPYGLICHQGLRGESCSSDGQCQDGFCVQRPSGWGTCTDGVVCRSDDQCAQGSCEERPGSWGTCSDDSPCAVDAECSAGACLEAMTKWGSCEPGGTGQSCFDAGDCQSASCLRPGLGSFGSCADGSLGSPCASDMECASGFCYDAKSGQGVCTTGEAGAECAEGSDCISNSCMLQPGNALPGTCQP